MLAPERRSLVGDYAAVPRTLVRKSFRPNNTTVLGRTEAAAFEASLKLGRILCRAAKPSAFAKAYEMEPGDMCEQPAC